jgi:diguanylate cyclase (GGDEF)-like protein
MLASGFPDALLVPAMLPVAARQFKKFLSEPVKAVPLPIYVPKRQNGCLAVHSLHSDQPFTGKRWFGAGHYIVIDCRFVQPLFENISLPASFRFLVVMFFKGRTAHGFRPVLACADNSPAATTESAVSDQTAAMNGFFRRARAPNIIGHFGASIVTVALCWPYADPARLIAWLITHQVSILLMLFCFTSRWTTSRLNRHGIPRFATFAQVLAMTTCGSVMLVDIQASENIAFTLSALIVTYAVAAGAMITLGPIEKLARYSLFGLLLPGTLVSLYVGHIVIGSGTLFFLAVVAMAGVSEMNIAYQELMALRANSVKAAADSKFLACHDSLTGLFSRIGIAEAFISSDCDFRSAMFIDLDRFKQVNDQAGHQTGDLLLIEVANRLKTAIPSGAIAGRLGGDEFLILQQASESDYLREFSRKIVGLLEAPFEIRDATYSISASVGISIIEKDATLEEFFYESDNAMYQAKREQRGSVVIFTDNLKQQIQLRTALENELRSIVDRNEFPVLGQPVYDLETGRIRAVELLARPQLTDGTLPSPSMFIPLLEEMGLIHEATRILLRQATEIKAAWQGNPDLCDVAIAINISPRSLACDWLITDVCEQMIRNGLHPGDLIFEITEHALISDVHQSEITLQALCELGITIALDDFGTGYSSLDRLLRMPISYVKIDKSIVQKIGSCDRNARLMQAIVEVAKSLGQEIVAEGIETESQLSAVRLAGVVCGQGYYLAKPLPLDQLPRLANSGHPTVDNSVSAAPQISANR